MAEFKELDSVLSVCGQVGEDDLIMAQGLGFKTIVNNRPDGEKPDQPASAQVAQWAKNLNLKYIHLPIPSDDLPFESVIELGEVYSGNDGPILAFCASGMRSSALWAFLMTVITEAEVDEIVEQPLIHGFDLSTLKHPMQIMRNAIMKAQEET